jgi:hypothetical protein
LSVTEFEERTRGDAPLTPNHAPARDDRAGSYVLVHVAQPRPKPWRPTQWPKAVAIALGVALAGGGAHWSAAQRSDAPRITVAPMIQAEPASQAPLGIKVDPIGSLPSNSFVRLRGFPTSVSLTEGHAIAPGAWAIPLFGLASLKAIVPAGVSGRAEITITLVDVDGNTLAQTRTALVIAAPPPPPEKKVAALPTPEKLEPPRALPPISPTPPTVETQPKQAAALLPPPMSADAKAQAERMLANAEKHMEQGNIGAARSFLQRAAEAGLAEAALKLGDTYDPAELARVAPLLASSADPKEAKKWYEKARDLGAPEAVTRLMRLGGR